MLVQALGYLGFRTRRLEDWRQFGTNFLGMQLVDKGRSTVAFRMDDRKQRIIVTGGEETLPFYGWEVADRPALEQVAKRLEIRHTAVSWMSQADCAERHVTAGIRCKDPTGNEVEIFNGPEIASDAFKPSRAITGFRTGPLGMGHVVLKTDKIDETTAFYEQVLGFRLSDYTLRPFKAYFYHVNPRHHSLAFLETLSPGIHHMMMELFSIDDVGHTYDIALGEKDRIVTTLGRHLNDYMFSFYSRSPSDFFVEYGWGGRDIDPSNWKPAEVTGGPSLWGHDRSWLPPEKRQEARDLRMKIADEGVHLPVTVSEGNYETAAGACAWFDTIKKTTKRKRSSHDGKRRSHLDDSCGQPDAAARIDRLPQGDR